MKRKSARILLGFILSLVMAISVLPQTIFANQPATDAERDYAELVLDIFMESQGLAGLFNQAVALNDVYVQFLRY